MSQIVRTAHHLAARSLARQGLDEQWSEVGEVVAALLGYRSLAALGREYAEVRTGLFLDDAQILVLNELYGHTRASEMQWNRSVVDLELTVRTCIECLIQSASRAAVYVGVDDFYSSWACEAMAEAIFLADDVSLSSKPLAWPEMSCEVPQAKDLWASAHDWQIEGRGTVQELADVTNADSASVGVFLNATGCLVFQKAGSAGLVFLHAEGSCFEASTAPWLNSRSQLTSLTAPPFTLLH